MLLKLHVARHYSKSSWVDQRFPVLRDARRDVRNCFQVSVRRGRKIEVIEKDLKIAGTKYGGSGQGCDNDSM